MMRASGFAFLGSLSSSVALRAEAPPTPSLGSSRFLTPASAAAGASFFEYAPSDFIGAVHNEGLPHETLTTASDKCHY